MESEKQQRDLYGRLAPVDEVACNRGVGEGEGREVQAGEQVGRRGM